MDIKSKHTALLVRIGLLIVMVAFFLPFVLVSCGDETMEISAFDLTTGFTLMGETMPANILMAGFFIIPLVALLASLKYKNLSGIVLLLIISDAVLLLFWNSSLNQRMASATDEYAMMATSMISIGYGYKLSLAGNALAGASMIWTLLISNDADDQQLSTPPVPKEDILLTEPENTIVEVEQEEPHEVQKLDDEMSFKDVIGNAKAEINSDFNRSKLGMLVGFGITICLIVYGYSLYTDNKEMKAQLANQTSAQQTEETAAGVTTTEDTSSSNKESSEPYKDEQGYLHTSNSTNDKLGFIQFNDGLYYNERFGEFDHFLYDIMPDGVECQDEGDYYTAIGQGFDGNNYKLYFSSQADRYTLEEVYYTASDTYDGGESLYGEDAYNYFDSLLAY